MKAPTRVVVAGFYPPPYAGEPIHVKQLAQFLRDHGVPVQILNLNRHAPPSADYRSATKPWTLAWLLLSLPDRSAVLHLHTNGHSWKSWLMILAAALGARVKRTRALLTIHSGLFPGYVARLGSFGRRFCGWILRSFASVIAVNPEIGRAMRELGLSESNVSVIPAFLGVREVGALDDQDRVLVDGRRPFLVVVGGGDRDPEKGIPTVVDALPSLIATHPGLCSVFVGWQVGPKTSALIEAARLGTHAVCLGELSHDRCLRFLQHADVVVRSTFADGDAITVREALDLGIPVVASDTDFRPDGVVLFRKGDSKDLADKILQVLSTSTPASEPEAEGQRPADALWSIYADLLGDRRPAGPSSACVAPRRAPASPP
jgi:glycosyltransferase involved in cell wall biosynthesis